MPELFHHQSLFFGCLTVRRVNGVPSGFATNDIALATQAFGDALSERCPALDSEQRCSVHGDRKPVTCQVVPFDAWLPDDRQHLVLASRAAEAHYLGSDCITAGTRDGFPVVTRQLRVVDDGARAALATRRRDLRDEQRFWGRAAFELLQTELFASPRFVELPPGGFLTLPMAPVLLVLASVSERCRERCIAYLDAQALLCERPHRNRDVNNFARANARLCVALRNAAPPARALPSDERAALEHWLGLS